MIMNSIMHLKVFPIFAVSVHINGLYTRFFNPHARTNAPHVMYNFFLLYIKTTRINYLVKFLSKPPPSFQPSISQIIWIYVCILHNKEKEKISKKLRMSFSNLTFRSWLVLWNPANAWLSTCNHYCTIYSKEIFSV